MDEATVSANPPVHTEALVEMGSKNGWVPSGVAWKCIAANRPAVVRVEDLMAADYDGCPGVSITVGVETGGLHDFAMVTVPLAALETIVDQARARR